MSLLWIFAYLVTERFFELCLSRRHRLALLARGGKEFYPETFKKVVALHSLFLLALFMESYPWLVTVKPFTVIILTLLVVLQAVRYWCIISLGEYWNTRIMVVSGESVKKIGPYRWLSHPNYLVVTLEFLLLPLLMHAPYTLALFFPANLIIICQRIRLEETSLRKFTDYNQQFPQQ